MLQLNPKLKDEHRGLFYAAFAVLFFSTAPVLIRWGKPLSPYVIAWGRVLVGAVAVYCLAVLQGNRPRFQRTDWPKFFLYGLVTALHFLCYIASLSLTTIAHSLTLTYTSPVFVTLGSWLFLKEPVGRRKYLGVAVSVLGVAILAGFEPQLTRQMVIGDLLALGSALCFGFYSIAGRSQRGNYPLLTYAFGLYGLAAFWLTPVALVTFTSPGIWRPVWAIVALGILPLALGHTFYNAALRRTHATYVNLVATQEVTGGIILGCLLLGEVPTFNSILGAAITLMGIAMVLI
jgi:drug/metabolite transporter (DMT)-like permease